MIRRLHTKGEEQEALMWISVANIAVSSKALHVLLTSRVQQEEFVGNRNVSVQHVRSILNRLVEAGLLIVVRNDASTTDVNVKVKNADPDADICHVFAHELTRSCAYDLLPSDHRRRMHGCCALNAHHFVERDEEDDSAPSGTKEVRWC